MRVGRYRFGIYCLKVLNKLTDVIYRALAEATTTATATKTSLIKSEVALLQTLYCLFHLVQFVKCWQFFLELSARDCIEVQGKKKKVVGIIDCKTAGVFLKISKEIGKTWRKSLNAREAREYHVPVGRVRREEKIVLSVSLPSLALCFQPRSRPFV